jgi:hypothetical protein
VNALSRLRQWRPPSTRADDSPWDSDTPSWLASLVVHLAILGGLALVGVVGPHPTEIITLLTSPNEPEDLLTTSQDFSYSSTPQEAIGAAGVGDSDALATAAPALSLTAALPSSQQQLDVSEPQSAATERIAIQEEIRVATGARFAENLSIKGAPGVGATGATGAIDRITQEILLSLEERKTLVVWLFDQSGSLERQRAEINKRFDRIYEELGVIEASGDPAFKKHENKPLLSSVVAFGQKITLLTPKPTDEVSEIKAAVAGMKTDDSGIERVFAAVYETVDRYRQYRTQEPRRNVMIVIFTDEAGDDENELDRTVNLCRRHEVPVYAIGVPAPFGRREALVKYVDPDPKYDQTPQWIPVRQGPESYMPELVKIGSAEYDEPMDSGFGPYSLTRLCYETGGIFFAVHPNRDGRGGVSRRETAVLSAQLSHFFDPEVMRTYRPDYVPIREYQKLLSENKARAALVEAAQMSWITPMEQPTLVFPKVDDAQLANRLSQAQRAAAILEPKINQLYELLKQGEKDRPRLTRPRWQAGYDLSMGRVLAVKVRTESYNAMLAKAKQGMRFAEPKNDTWRLVPADEISVGSALEKQAAAAKTYLERVVAEHPGTPWALLAERELKQPFGWVWNETYTGVNAPRQVAGNNNNNPRPPQNDKARMLPRPEKRPPPKL